MTQVTAKVKPVLRGRPAKITREAIVDAAEALIARHGVQALTLRRVAGELGVTPMAMYRHVKDKNALLVLLLDALYNRFGKPTLPEAPRERLIAFWRFLHDGLAANPWVVTALVESDAVAVSVLPTIDAILEASIACGLTLESSATLYRLVWQYTVGELILQESAEGRTTVKTSPVLRTIASEAPPRLPHLASAAPYWQALRTRSIYVDGLTALIDGFLQRSRPAD
jgi:AcrR family transcriptional regulator